MTPIFIAPQPCYSENSMLLKDLADFLGSTVEGPIDAEIRAVAALDDATATDISFVTRGRAAKNAPDSAAGCLLVPPDFENTAARTVIRVRDPRAATAKLIGLLQPPRRPAGGVHPTAVIGADVTIGEGTSIGAGAVIGDHCRIGSNCVIHPRVTLYDDVTLGNNVTIHSGAVIGADGFGFVFTEGRYEKFPQVGRVEIDDDVEIGANCTIDRAALGVTSIGVGTKLDNMVHIAHNCRLGRHVVIAAQTGLSGGVIVEDYAVIGGQVGIGDKAIIQSRAVLGSGSGVLTSKIVRGGEVMWGTPARPLKEHLAQLAALSKLAKKDKLPKRH